MSKAVIIPECNKDIGGMKEEVSLSPSDKKMGLLSRLLRFDSLGKKNVAPESPTSTEPPVTYYGVYIPCEIKKGPDEEALHVYTNKSEAMEMVRRYNKLARFKAFTNRQDALSFALRGAEPVDSTDGNDNSLMGEKPYPFKAPSPQDMVALRKAIEAGHLTTVSDRVWDNPRYLVSSGNTPSILQEGARYNALHIAAKALNAEICNFILTTVGNPAFIQTLYGSDADPEACKEFAEILVDRYLNTPDKAINETPLHFAAKFGADEVVEVLTSFPQCQVERANKLGQLPRDMICSRCPAGAAGVAEKRARVMSLLAARYYVPVLHADDHSLQPTVGMPFSPHHPPDINKDPLSPRREILAYAGPMAAPDAAAFRRRWNTPPRAPAPAAPGAASAAPAAARRPFRLKEMTKGLEAVGRDLAEKMKVGWKEYWPFLDTFTDLRTTEGLKLFENYLKNKYETNCSYIYSDTAQSQMSHIDLSLSRISLGNTTQSPMKEHASPMSELCMALKTCSISDRPSHFRKTDPLRQRMCRQPTKLVTLSNGDATPPPVINHTVNQLLCIERTCQVFAKRIADALTFSLTAEPEVASDSLKSEAKHLQHTMFTYMDDERFKNIDFALIHSRLAQLVVYKLKQQVKELDDINHLLDFITKLRCPNDDIFSSDDERKPATYRYGRVRLSHVIEAHVRCLASFIYEELTESEVCKGPSAGESECRDMWERAGKCRCEWKVESFERNSKKNASFRKNRSILSTSPKSESFIRRLSFDHDIGDGRQRAAAPERPPALCSPAGDSAPAPPVPPPHTPAAPANPDTLTKCRLPQAEISEDESDGNSSETEEVYETASEAEDSDAEPMHDASDAALVEPFIYGEEPTKVDRLVYEALGDASVSREVFPHVYRWRHHVALYSHHERHLWQPATHLSDTVSLSIPCSPLGGRGAPGGRGPVPPGGPGAAPAPLTPRRPAPAPHCSTPNRDTPREERSLPLQVSSWLRVTGPNSPRAALAARAVSNNVSFGF